jgi:sugar lactone lactonase YvrE
MKARSLQALLLVTFATAAAQAQAQPKTIALPAGSRPESITKGWGGKYYVSLQYDGKVGANDGQVVQIDLASGAVTPLATGLDNPRGLAFTGELLVVTDTDKVWKIDQAGKKSLLAETAAFPQPPVFFNDAAPAFDGADTGRGGRAPIAKAVYVTEMGPGRAVQRDPAGLLWPSDSVQAAAIPTAARVYRITIDGKVTNAFSPTRKLLVTNGVTEAKVASGGKATGKPAGKPGKGGHLLALDFFHGSVVDVDLERDTKTILATGPFRGCDGIEQARDGTIFVTSFENGRVWRMGADGENAQLLFDLAANGRQSLADLALDEEAQKLYVPDTAHATIVVLPTR